MAWEAARPGKASDELFETGIIEGQFGIIIMQRTFQIEICEHGGRTMSRPRDQEHIDIMTQDQVIEMRVYQVDARVGTPVTKQTIFDIFRFERFPQQRVALQINLGGRQIVSNTAKFRYRV